MNRIDHAVTREDRREQLVGMWARDKRGQATVLSLCHQALPEGETLRAGMSVFDVILDHEFGSQTEDESSLHRQSA